MTTVIPVGGSSPYDVVVGHGVLDRVPAMVAGASTVVVVSDPNVADRAAGIENVVRSAGVRVERLEIASGEQAKDLSTVASLWDDLGAMRVTRSDALVAVGGGATTDIVGFAAATWLRGVRVVHAPTTLLAMVDAAIGGKTGINTAAGKNLVGSFHPPAGVVVDLDVLETLPAEQWVNGMAEVVKAGFIADAAILELVESDPAAAADPSGPHTRELVERSITVKAEVVARDLREAGLREVLNYGHTLGHAIERAEDYRIPHGHAVSVGMCFVAAMARLDGRLDATTAERHAALLTGVGLPTTYREGALSGLLDTMRVDKKARGSRLRFVVLDGLAKPAILEDPDPSLLAAAYVEVSAP